MAATLITANRRRGLAFVLAVLLAGCTSMPDIKQVSLPVPQAATQAETQPAEEREHLRILAAYGGIYENARLQATIEKTVDRLVAASERPDLKYKVTILNSPAINAFALPNGHLYVTRGLIALANDKSELASVLAHEMGHVIARHAAIREDQARQAALISHVVSDVLSDPQMGALALAKSKLTLASFSRAQEFEADGIGVGISARAGFDPFGASRFLTDMQRNADLKPAAGSGEARAPDFLTTHPATPERVKNALANARQFSGPGSGERDRDEYLSDVDLWRRSERGLCARPPLFASKAQLHVPGAAGIYAGQYLAGGARPQWRRRGHANRRGQRAGRAIAPGLSKIGMDGEGRSHQRRGVQRQRIPCRDRDRHRRRLVVPAVRRAVRQRRLSFHFRGEK
jgi:predicted Zn-dependent protease